MAQPMMVEMNARHFDAEIAEGMEVAVVRAAPALEFDAELDRAVRRAEEFGGIEAQVAVEFVDRRHGRFADADGSDRPGFDGGDAVRLPRESAAERRGAHPARGAAVNDDDAPPGTRPRAHPSHQNGRAHV